MKSSVQEVISYMKEVDIMVNFETFDPKGSMKSQGIDSLDLASLFFLVEEKTGVKISDSDMENIESVQDLVDFIEAG